MVLLETYRHRPDGHDGICARCGGVLSPLAAVQHFGVEVLTADPVTRVRLLHARKAQLHTAWAGGVSIPAPRAGSDVLADLAARGVDTRRPLVLPCRELPLRSPVARQLVDVLGAVSRALDRRITRAMRPAPRRRDSLARKSRR